MILLTVVFLSLLIIVNCNKLIGNSINRVSFDSTSNSNNRRKYPRHSIYIRGGSTDIDTKDNYNNEEQQGPCTILVSTSVGSSFLDKKKRLTVNRNATVADLKQQLQLKFPGGPPISLQKLFYGVKSLKDDDVIGNITTASSIPILLDMLTGTSVYNKTMSITQALEAYASVIVHQAYIGDKMKAQYAALSSPAQLVSETSNTTTSEDSTTDIMETAIYREMFDSVKKSLYETYAEDIYQALEEEKEPETITGDTAAWRGDKVEVGPLNELLAKQFDMNFKSVKMFAYYSILLAIFAYFGTNTSLSSQFLIVMVPVLWVSKVRQLRLAYKLLLNLILPILPKVDFLMPLLPASLQVIAIELANIDAPIKVVTGKRKKDLVADSLDSNNDEDIYEEEDAEEEEEEDDDEEEEEEDDDEEDEE